MSKRLLILEDGHVFEGKGFGGNNFQVGELVFHTGMMAYQEVLSDLSYHSQIVVMTYPMIGNFGINRDAFESMNSAVFGFVVGEHSEKPCNWRSEMTFDEFLKMRDIPGISDIDTRMLTKIIRNKGEMKAIMSDDENIDIDATVAMLQQYQMPNNQVEQVATQRAFQVPNEGKRVVLLDFGSKNNIVRELNRRNIDLVVLPFNASAETIMMLHPDGVILSDGPGDPNVLMEVVNTIKSLIGKMPMFAIGLGHELLALACGAKVEKMKFGHRGGNHPVLCLKQGKTLITSQNHSYVVNEDSLKDTELVLTHRALNDKSVEGLSHSSAPLFSVQFHPEEESELYDEFYSLMNTNKEEK